MFKNLSSEAHKPKLRQLEVNMENELQARDRIGVQDFVLLEDFKSEDAFLDNLRKRYKADLIYVSTCMLNLAV